MKRTLIRTLGVCFGIIVSVFGRTRADVYKGNIYRFDGNTIPRSGFMATITDNQQSFVSRYCPNVGVNDVLWNSISECSGFSYCNSTGVYCSNQSFFASKGCSFLSDNQMGGTGTGCYYRNATWSEQSGGGYTFIGCDTGFYFTSTGGSCAPNTSGIASLSVLANCCKPCPIYNHTATGGITVPNTGQVSGNCESGWCWTAQGGVGITSCRATPDGNQVFSDSAGTYTYPTGCAYQN